tara:strand:+ start:1916 stop:2134 length:219 start_codon:yes stop_codon:yes gene_type:complete
MKYSEIKENYSPDRDKHNSIELDDTRKKRLTLSHLNDLRKIRTYREYKNDQKKVQLKTQYGGSAKGSETPDL